MVQIKEEYQAGRKRCMAESEGEINALGENIGTLISNWNHTTYYQSLGDESSG